MQIQMDHPQRIIGTQRNVFELDINTYLYGEASSIQCLWEQNTKYGVHL